MNQTEVQILVAHVVTMGLLDGEIERSLVAFVGQDDQDISASAERLAEERGAVLLHLEDPEIAVLVDNRGI